MKVLFVGPTLYEPLRDGRLPNAPEIVCRPPARQGDIACAVLEGAHVIGLVDGRYEDVAAPWHKEILFALQEGVTVLGGASLGALRAAECEAFGMIGVGRIFERYAAGDLVDDSDVAQLHAPADLGFMPITEPFVNVEATIEQCLAVGDLESAEADALVALARRIFFKDLTLSNLAAQFYPAGQASLELAERLERNRIDAKKLDALDLVAAMLALPDRREVKQRSWRLAEPAKWRAFIDPLVRASQDGPKRDFSPLITS